MLDNSIKQPKSSNHTQIKSLIKNIARDNSTEIHPILVQKAVQYSSTSQDSRSLMGCLIDMIDQKASHSYIVYKCLFIIQACLQSRSTSFLEIAKNFSEEIRLLTILSFEGRECILRREIHQTAFSIYNFLVFNQELSKEDFEHAIETTFSKPVRAPNADKKPKCIKVTTSDAFDFDDSDSNDDHLIWGKQMQPPENQEVQSEIRNQPQNVFSILTDKEIHHDIENDNNSQIETHNEQLAIHNQSNTQYNERTNSPELNNNEIIQSSSENNQKQTYFQQPPSSLENDINLKQSTMKQYQLQSSQKSQYMRSNQNQNKGFQQQYQNNIQLPIQQHQQSQEMQQHQFYQYQQSIITNQNQQLQMSQMQNIYPNSQTHFRLDNSYEDSQISSSAPLFPSIQDQPGQYHELFKPQPNPFLEIPTFESDYPSYQQTSNMFQSNFNAPDQNRQTDFRNQQYMINTTINQVQCYQNSGNKYGNISQNQQMYQYQCNNNPHSQLVQTTQYNQPPYQNYQQSVQQKPNQIQEQSVYTLQYQQTNQNLQTNNQIPQQYQQLNQNPQTNNQIPQQYQQTNQQNQIPTFPKDQTNQIHQQIQITQSYQTNPMTQQYQQTNQILYLNQAQILQNNQIYPQNQITTPHQYQQTNQVNQPTQASYIQTNQTQVPQPISMQYRQMNQQFQIQQQFDQMNQMMQQNRQLIQMNQQTTPNFLSQQYNIEPPTAYKPSTNMQIDMNNQQYMQQPQVSNLFSGQSVSSDPFADIQPEMNVSTTFNISVESQNLETIEYNQTKQNSNMYSEWDPI